MNQKAYKALEYYKIINMLTDKASSSMGKEICRKLEPSTDIDEIRHMQTQTRDALTRLFQKGNISFGSVKDVRGSLKRLEIGSSLGIGELLAICSLLENTNRVKAYSRSERGDSLPDSLDGMFEALEPLTPLTTEIRRCILSEDEISDDASSNLRQIRRNMKITGDRIHTQLSSLVNGSARNYLQDSVITMRNGRYCIPVKAEYKGQVPGMVHDQSSTGSTLFIEPMAIVKLNNDIRELELEEQKEIEVILSTLSQQTAEQTDSIRADLNIMVQLDVIFARASLAMDMNATEPIFNDEGRIRLKQARHPLIDKKKAVPIDIRLGDDFDLLVITGPNTGGKTVSLKTVGLLTLMGQSGLHIPTLDRSELALFEEVYADDEKALQEFMNIKFKNKERLAKYILEHNGVEVDPHSIFDVQVKRLHEYKRQLLNILHVIYLYNQIKMHPEMEFYPRTFIFGAKASAGYATAKKIIKLINSVADVVNNDASINGKIKVVFIENYRVSNAEWIFAAADVSEQISTASKEASGTGNMKFMLNGAPTLGTMDGANVEIVEEVGAENAFIFGLSSDEVINYENNGGYDPNVIYNTDEEIRQVLMQLINGTFSNDTELFRDLYDSLLNTKNTDRADRYFILADFRSYADAQKRVEAAYRDEKGWAKKALLNTACSGKFTSDRTIQEYVDDIWHLDKVIVRKK
mgnify:CR=1 FL=1